jgi:CO dehydrogenase/acetyl-CoA synthase alpha subunit
MKGAGKYDDIADELMLRLKAEGIVVIVFHGSRGDGASAKATNVNPAGVPILLRQMAADMERDILQAIQNSSGRLN